MSFSLRQFRSCESKSDQTRPKSPENQKKTKFYPKYCRDFKVGAVYMYMGSDTTGTTSIKHHHGDGFQQNTMSRPTRIVIPNIPYHVTQRGNQARDVFFHPNDRKRYLEKLTSYSNRFGFDIQAYCLMSNHIHLLGIPRNKNSIAKTMQVVQSNHTRTINLSQGWTGNLWQQRYSASALNIPHMWNTLRYIEQNPVRAGIVLKCEDYIWSSAASHCGIRDDALINTDPRYSDMFDNWHEIVNQVLDDETLEDIRYRTRKGFPCGERRLIKVISKKVISCEIEKCKIRTCNAH